MKEDNNRLKVEKNINRKAMLFSLSFSYFFIYIGILFLSALLLLNFSLKKLFFVIIIDTVAYMVIKFLDTSNFFEEVNFVKLPSIIDNDLYIDRNERNRKVVKCSTDISSKE